MSSDLWNFSLELYARPGVEQSCLSLQQAGASVCLLLCGLWLERRGVACEEQRVQQLCRLALPWDLQVVQPLRALRTQWKAGALQDAALSSLREQVKTLELAAERQLLERLETAAGRWPEGQHEAAAQWLHRLAQNTAPPSHDALHQLRALAFDT